MNILVLRLIWTVAISAVLPAFTTGDFSCVGKQSGMYADPLDCSAYYQCLDSGALKQLACKEPNLFSEYKQDCREASGVRCGKRPINPPGFSCTNRKCGVYASERNCTIYWSCDDKGGLTQGVCDHGTLFNPTTLKCDVAEFVTCLTLEGTTAAAPANPSPPKTTRAPTTTTEAPKPFSCKDNKSKSSTSKIYPFGPQGKAISVKCDHETDGGGWTVIQYRASGPVDEFSKSWVDYEDGFGSSSGNYWLGLKAIHELTAASPQSLMVVLTDYEGETKRGTYKSFSVGNTESKYKLTVDDFSTEDGLSDEGLSHGHDGSFSTYDQDNDSDNKKNCADVYAGGWWFNTCREGSLNGLYKQNTKKQKSWNGITWVHAKSWSPFKSDIKTTELKIRPA